MVGHYQTPIVEMIVVITLGYLGFGVVHAVSELAHETRRDNWDNLMKHKPYIFRHIFGWPYYVVRGLLYNR